MNQEITYGIGNVKPIQDSYTQLVLSEAKVHTLVTINTTTSSKRLRYRANLLLLFTMLSAHNASGETKMCCILTKIEKNVKILGRVPEKKLILMYQRSDIFILPSAVELEGMVVLEAMASGVPVILANSKDSASPYLLDKNGLLFTPHDSRDLAEKITTLLDSPQMRKKMGKRSLKLSRRYDIKKSIEKLESVYQSL